METENQSVAATEETAATKNGGNATQEVSSTTESPEYIKRHLRVQTWRRLKDNHYVVRFVSIFNRIPTFLDVDKAGEILLECEEFKKANNIKVAIDRPLYEAKFRTLSANKNLYLPPTRSSKALYLKVDVPEDATEAKKIEILNAQNLEKYRTEIFLDNKIELDMVIIGSVVVSKDGYRIGRGNGFTDLDIGLLCEVGSITDKTIIATTVHDSQVVDSLPTHIFQKYDTPVDLIITPTQVIRVEKRLPRPTGIFWELLSERRVKLIPVLQELKESKEKEGKVIVLKDEDTDIERIQQNNHRRFLRRRFVYRRYQRRALSQNNADKQQQDGENQQRRNLPPKRRFVSRRRRPTKSEGDQSGAESKSQEAKPVAEGGEKKPRARKNRMTRDFSVKLTNISREVRIRDLKSELRNRQCNPMSITWKGQLGRCYLHFGHRRGLPHSVDEEKMNKVLESLNNLSLTISESNPKKKTVVNGEGDGDAAAGDDGKPQEKKTEVEEAEVAPTKVIKLKVELVKRVDKATKYPVPPPCFSKISDSDDDGDVRPARIESLDVSTV